MYPFSFPNLPKFRPFLFLHSLLLLSENLNNNKKEMKSMTTTSVDKKQCDYCSGTGYFQLLLGGSETCNCCEGTGKKKE